MVACMKHTHDVLSMYVRLLRTSRQVTYLINGRSKDFFIDSSTFPSKPPRESISFVMRACRACNTIVLSPLRSFGCLCIRSLTVVVAGLQTEMLCCNYVITKPYSPIINTSISRSTIKYSGRVENALLAKAHLHSKMPHQKKKMQFRIQVRLSGLV